MGYCTWLTVFRALYPTVVQSDFWCHRPSAYEALIVSPDGMTLLDDSALFMYV
jgi:hypothetical protein